MIGLILVLIILGVILQFIPMDAKVRQIIYVVIVIAVILCLLDMFDIWSISGARWHYHR